MHVYDRTAPDNTHTKILLTTHPKPITPPPQPKPHHALLPRAMAIDGGPHLGVLPVQVGLLGDVEVEVVLVCFFVVGPC